MARYNPEHKDATRKRIIETAGRRFKTDGFDGAGVTTLMTDAGLTNGAFYAHFGSKADLIGTVVADQLATQYEMLTALPAGKDAVRTYIGDYLSPEHRDNPASGCPSAALADEIVRCDDTVRAAYTSGLARLIDLVAARLDPDEPESARQHAIGIFTVLVATLQLARAVSEPTLSDQILKAGRVNALALVG